ncbi:MAG TPA: nitroreductase family protein [Candidatus Anoxymicrobiaceae bacterium]
MLKAMDPEFNERLDNLIEVRRTIRSFTDEIPSRESIEQIIKAGLLAPYAPPTVGNERLFRRFFVLERGGESMDKASALAIKHMKANAENLKKRCEADPAVAEQAGEFAKRMEMIAASGKVPFTEAPFFIVVAEKKGLPPVEMQSLAHCLQNMWLKATALGLGFRLISLTSMLGQDPEFCELIGIPPGEFGFNGCTIGYATEWPPNPAKPSLDEVTKWL